MALSQTYAQATAVAGALCLCIALLQVTDIFSARSDLLQVGSQFQQHAATGFVALPQAGSAGFCGPRENWEKVQVLWICRGVGVFPSRLRRNEYKI